MTLLRQWAMLQEIPRAPRRKSTMDIYKALLAQDHQAKKRTVERDLERLSSIFHYTCDTEGRTQHWYWPEAAKLLDLPAMDAPVAVAFLLSHEYLTPLLPPASLQVIGPYFSRAQEYLSETRAPMGAWGNRVCVLQRGPRLQTPKVPIDVQAEVYDAVLAGKQLEVEYRTRGSSDTKPRCLHPLGLVVYEGVVYLIATANEHKKPFMWTLHRVQSAKCLKADAKRDKNFDLKAYAREAFRFPVSGDTLRLVVRFDEEVVQHLEERPLSLDQVCRHDRGFVDLTATVPDTEDLRWWLLGFGASVEVMAPASLRAEMKKTADRMAKRYAK